LSLIFIVILKDLFVDKEEDEAMLQRPIVQKRV